MEGHSKVEKRGGAGVIRWKVENIEFETSFQNGRHIKKVK